MELTDDPETDSLKSKNVKKKEQRNGNEHTNPNPEVSPSGPYLEEDVPIRDSSSRLIAWRGIF